MAPVYGRRNSKYKDGRCGKPEHQIWRAMLTRCTNPKAYRAHRYIGRGIEVCERWKDFANFYADMGPRPHGASLDRVDNDRGYSPDNCRWATYAEQGANTSQNRMLTAHGVTLHLSGWAQRMGIKSDVLWKRLKRHPGLPLEAVLR